jgi:hypothetical protein
MFKQNKYTKIYYEIINLARSRSLTGYFEKHHVIPKSLGGANDQENIVKLTAREHFICHRLLVKMVEGRGNQAKMAYAAWQQTRKAKDGEFKITSRTYEALKHQLSTYYTGRKRAPFSQQAKDNMREGAKTRAKVIHSAERLEKFAANRCKTVAGWNKGLKLSLTDEQRAVMSEKFSKANLGKPKKKIPCPHCGRDIGINAFSTWHGDRCKHRLS